MRIYDWLALKVKRLSIHILCPGLKGCEDMWDKVDRADRIFLLVVLFWVIVPIGVVLHFI